MTKVKIQVVERHFNLSLTLPEMKSKIQNSTRQIVPLFKSLYYLIFISTNVTFDFLSPCSGTCWVSVSWGKRWRWKVFLRCPSVGNISIGIMRRADGALLCDLLILVLSVDFCVDNLLHPACLILDFLV